MRKCFSWSLFRLCLVGISQTPGCVSLLPASLFSNFNPGTNLFLLGLPHFFIKKHMFVFPLLNWNNFFHQINQGCCAVLRSPQLGHVHGASTHRPIKPSALVSFLCVSAICCWKENYAHRGYIYLTNNTVKTVILLNTMTIYCLYIYLDFFCIPRSFSTSDRDGCCDWTQSDIPRRQWCFSSTVCPEGEKRTMIFNPKQPWSRGHGAMVVHMLVDLV